MAANVEIEIKGLEKFQKKINEAPDLARQTFADALNASISQLSANAIDNGADDIFRFITPRAQRTGQLSLSFNEGIQLATAANLEASIGPTKFYAIIVHEGLGRMKQANPFMERIAKAAKPAINQIFEEHLETFVRKLT